MGLLGSLDCYAAEKVLVHIVLVIIAATGSSTPMLLGDLFNVSLQAPWSWVMGPCVCVLRMPLPYCGVWAALAKPETSGASSC